MRERGGERVRRAMGRVMLMGLLWLLFVSSSSAAPSTDLYDGAPPAHPGVDAFYRYMALLGQKRYEEAFQYRAGVRREAFFQQARAEWQDYQTLYARRGFTFLGWDVRAVDYSEDAGGNAYIRLIQIFRLRKGDRLILRHTGFLYRVTFRNQQIYTLDPYRGEFLREEERPFPAAEQR